VVSATRAEVTVLEIANYYMQVTQQLTPAWADFGSLLRHQSDAIP
jgi:hypothetical protein